MTTNSISIRQIQSQLDLIALQEQELQLLIAHFDNADDKTDLVELLRYRAEPRGGPLEDLVY